MRAGDHARWAHGDGAAGVDFHKQWGGEGFGCSGWAWAKAKAGVAIMRVRVTTIAGAENKAVAREVAATLSEPAKRRG